MTMDIDCCNFKICEYIQVLLKQDALRKHDLLFWLVRCKECISGLCFLWGLYSNTWLKQFVPVKKLSVWNYYYYYYYVTTCQRIKTAIEHENDNYSNWKWWTWNDPQKLGKGIGRVGNQRTSLDYRNYIIVEISQSIQTLVVSQIPVKHHQLTQVWKTHKKYI